MFKRFLATEYERQQAQKRGGRLKHLLIDFDSGEDRYRFEPTDDWTPERLYERRWALTLLQRVVNQLQDEYQAKDKAELFEHCQVYLTGFTGRPAHADTAAKLDMTEGAVRVTIHHMRRRYRELLTEEIAHTVEQKEDIDAELAVLRAAIRGEKNH